MKILGVHMIGRARCADLIAKGMEFQSSAEDISRMSHAHPKRNLQSVETADVN